MATSLPPYATIGQRIRHYAFRIFCGLVFFYLIFPILVIVPLSFNAQNFFTFTPEMLRLDPEGFSLRHYRDFLGANGDNSWLQAFRNSLIVAPLATLLAVSLGTLAAIGLTQPHVPYRKQIEMPTRIVATARIVGLICSRRPVNICQGRVF